MITIIVAATRDMAIGRGGDLLYHISDDLKRFKSLTMGWPIIMGRKTFESFPKGALPGRRNIVVTRNAGYTAPGVETASSLDEALAMCKGSENVFITGGGEIYRQAKNDYRVKDEWRANDNKLRYVLLGDPALRTVMPSQKIELTAIGDRPVTPIGGDEEPVQLMAREQTVIKGRVTDAAGNLATGFNGVVTATLYDAEMSVTTRGNGKDGEAVTFDRQGGRLFVGNGKVANGEFTLNVVMPAEVSNNYRPAAFSLYAYADDGGDATGVCRDLYVYGYRPECRA